ncbi:MAG TPA: hypothetical protein PLE59_07885 [Bacteroidales bacterium]|nr:hypothetical protein [Patescibacteria group bacterium]HOF07566.1 hypothetical protein [Bacteroidales bacterium]HON98190.1 hypothetical protein [Bacteroidales bacterium]HOS20731.1 hypothetical protein [Bacteroidales bacterium]HOU82927.1 hypothetical protein [Bacteroidales bacterium]
MKKLKAFCILLLLNLVVSVSILANNNLDNKINYEFFYQGKDTIYYTTGEYRISRIKSIRHAYLIYLSNSTMDILYTLVTPKCNVRLPEKLKEGETYIMQIIYFIPTQKYVKYVGHKFITKFKMLDKDVRISRRNLWGTIILSPNVLDKYYRKDYFLGPEFFKEVNNHE